MPSSSGGGRGRRLRKNTIVPLSYSDAMPTVLIS